MEYEVQVQGRARFAAWRAPAWRFTLIGVVLLAHFLVLNWLQAHLHRPAPALATRVLPPGLSGHIVIPVPLPQADRPLQTVDQADTATSVAAPAKRQRGNFVAAPAKPVRAPDSGPAAVNAGTSQVQPGANDGAAASASPRSGSGGSGNRLDLALPSQIKPSYGTALQAQRQLDAGRPLSAGVAGGAVTLTEHRRNDGSVETRVTTPLGCYYVRTPGTLPFMSDRPMDRTALPRRCL